MHVLIIGAGLAGLTTAEALHAQGARVTIVDRQPGPGLETSFANGAMLTPSQADPWNSPGVLRQLLGSLGRDDAALLLRPRALPSLAGWGLAFLWNSGRPRFERALLRNVRLARYAQERMRTLRETLGLAFDHRASGTAKVFRDAKALRDGVATARFLEQAGVRHRVLDASALVAEEPALAAIESSLAGAILFPDDEVGDARLFCEALQRHLSQAGVRAVFETEVRGFARAKDRIVALETTQGRLEADAFVVAAGSYATPLLRGLGIRLPVRPAKGYSITVPGGDAPPRLPIVDVHLHAAVVPLGSRLRIAGTAEFTGFDLSLQPGRIANLRGLLRRIYPAIHAGLGDVELEAWAGLRPMSSDSVPVLGASPIENLFLNAGHGHLGWSMACGAGRLTADVVLGRTPALDPTDYALARFGPARRRLAARRPAPHPGTGSTRREGT